MAGVCGFFYERDVVHGMSRVKFGSSWLFHDLPLCQQECSSLQIETREERKSWQRKYSLSRVEN